MVVLSGGCLCPPNPRGHSTSSGDIFGGHKLVGRKGVLLVSRAEMPEMLLYFPQHSGQPPTQNDLGSSITSTEAESPCPVVRDS